MTGASTPHASTPGARTPGSSTPGSSTPDAFFERLYAGNPDPWRFTSSRYEREKYRATLAALPRAKFRAGLEVGCSIGVLTRLLARRCRTLLAVDVAEAALREARRRTRGLAGVAVRRCRVPAEFPDRRFDLIVLSEVLYFLSAADLVALADRVLRALQPGGVLLLVNWTGATGTPLPGAPATAVFVGRLGGRLRRLTRRRRPGYAMLVLRRPR